MVPVTSNRRSVLIKTGFPLVMKIHEIELLTKLDVSHEKVMKMDMWSTDKNKASDSGIAVVIRSL